MSVNYNQIVDELEQQITAVSTTIADKVSQIADLDKELPELRTQLAGLQQLKEQTDALIAAAASNTVDINLNINATGASGSTAINHDYAA